MPPKSELSAFLAALGRLLLPHPIEFSLHSLSLETLSCRAEVGTSGLGKNDSHSVLSLEMWQEFIVLSARKNCWSKPRT